MKNIEKNKNTIKSAVESGKKSLLEIKEEKKLPEDVEPEWEGGYHEDEKSAQMVKKIVKGVGFERLIIEKWAKKHDIYLGSEEIAEASMESIKEAMYQNMSLEGYGEYLETMKEEEEEKKREEEASKYDEAVIDGVDWNTDSFDALSKWIVGNKLTDVRKTVRTDIDKTEEVSKHITYDLTERAKLLMTQMKPLDYLPNLYRGTTNENLLDMQKGDEVPFGIGSFSKSWDEARGFGNVMIEISSPEGFYGLDVDRIYGDDNGYGALKKRHMEHFAHEKEVILRATHLRIMEMDKEHRKITVSPVLSEEKRLRKAREDRKALIDEFSAEFDKPLHRKPLHQELELGRERRKGKKKEK